jgi:dienelactone hydrolase
MTFALEAVPGWVDAVKQKYGNEKTKYACTGYCFGAPFVCNELAGTTVSAGAFGHPAFLEEHHFTNLKSKLRRSAVDPSMPDILKCRPSLLILC